MFDMRTQLLFVTSLALLFTACTPAPDLATQEMDHSQHSESTSSTVMTLDRLNASPRHPEWVEVKNGDKTIHTWVVYPESAEPAPVVILIHENKGLNDWARSMADQVAEAGYIAVAPDLLSGFSAERTRTSDFAMPDDATKAISALRPEDVQSDLRAVADWSETIAASNGKLVSAGFCWGGSKSFEFAANSDDLDMAMVFYGTGPTDASVYKTINAPVFGFYGGADARVNATIDTSKQEMDAAGKTFDPVIYEGAGHAFMRLGEDSNGEPANVAARNAAFDRMKELLSTL
jgi:carboxymethylenebutenolidase